MSNILESLKGHRISVTDLASVSDGEVRFSPVKSFWFFGMATSALVGGAIFFTWSGLLLFFGATGAVLLLGHSLGSHRKLIHNSFECPKALEYFLVYMGVQVGLAGPIGLLRAHELRDFAQRLPTCHDYLRHGSSFWKDGWWQLNCELRLANPPKVAIEPRIAQDRFYQFLETTWMLQQLPPALIFYVWGGWSFVFFGVCARITAGVFGHWLIGYFAHNDGDMHFEVAEAAVQGRNIRLASLLTMGECWHNNHHAYPGSARLGLFAGEWDPGWWMLVLLHRCGLAWNFRLPEDLPPRAELMGADCLGNMRLRSALRILPRQHLAIAPIWRVMKEDRVSLRLEWPATFLSRRSMTRLLGQDIELHVDPALDSLIVRCRNETIVGLPAVCLALAQRGRFGWLMAVALLTPAIVLENARQAMVFEPKQA